MAGTWIKNQDYIEVIQAVLQRKIRDTGRKTTPACMILCKPLKLSHLTLMNILKGSVSIRTCNRLIQAGWFTRADLDRRQSYQGVNNDAQSARSARSARSTNDAKQQEAREKAAYRRGFLDGHTVGFSDGHKEGYREGYKNNTSGRKSSADYRRGYQDGKAAGRSKAKQPKTDDAGLPVDKLQSLFNMNTDRGAAQGETVAARVAVGKVLSRWIKNKFGHTVEVKLS